MPRIVMTFKRDGTVLCKTFGFQGHACIDATNEIERVLGTVESEKKTEEYYMPNIDLAHISEVDRSDDFED